MRSVSIIRDGGTTCPIRERQGLSTVFLFLISFPLPLGTKQQQRPNQGGIMESGFFPSSRKKHLERRRLFLAVRSSFFFPPSFFLQSRTYATIILPGGASRFLIFSEVCTYLAMHCAKYGGGGVQVFFPGEEIHFSRRCSLSQKYNDFATRIYLP